MSNRMGSTPRERDPPTIQNRKVPVRRANAAYRSREYLSEKEVGALIAAAASVGRHGARDAALILVAYRHGLRVSELVSLRWDQVDLQQGLLHVTRLKHGIASVEAVVRAVEQAPSLEAACRNRRPAIELPGVLRWARRRVQAFKGLLPDRFPCPATLAAFATCLGVLEVLVALRPIGEPFLANLSTPLGFLPRRPRGGGRGGAYQQQVGPDPPGVAA